MKSFALKLQRALLALLGTIDGSKLFVVALFDSSFLSLPEVNDLLIISLSIKNPSNMLYYCLMTTLGSITGCLLLYVVGRKGGEVLLKRRFAEHQIERVSNWYSKYGVFAVMIPSILPPPTPFKIFVLSAGAFRVSLARFVFAITLGRGFRYFFEGFLAIRYGDRASEFMQRNYPSIAIGVVAAIVIVMLAYYPTRRSRQGRSGRESR